MANGNIKHSLTMMAKASVPSRLADARVIYTRTMLTSNFTYAPVRFGPANLTMVTPKTLRAFALINPSALAPVMARYNTF